MAACHFLLMLSIHACWFCCRGGPPRQPRSYRKFTVRSRASAPRPSRASPGPAEDSDGDDSKSDRITDGADGDDQLPDTQDMENDEQHDVSEDDDASSDKPPCNHYTSDGEQHGVSDVNAVDGPHCAEHMSDDGHHNVSDDDGVDKPPHADDMSDDDRRDVPDDANDADKADQEPHADNMSDDEQPDDVDVDSAEKPPRTPDVSDDEQRNVSDDDASHDEPSHDEDMSDGEQPDKGWKSSSSADEPPTPDAAGQKTFLCYETPPNAAIVYYCPSRTPGGVLDAMRLTKADPAHAVPGFPENPAGKAACADYGADEAMDTDEQETPVEVFPLMPQSPGRSVI
jgi:hypothetical protein